MQTAGYKYTWRKMEAAARYRYGWSVASIPTHWERHGSSDNAPSASNHRRRRPVGRWSVVSAPTGQARFMSATHGVPVYHRRKTHRRQNILVVSRPVGQTPSPDGPPARHGRLAWSRLATRRTPPPHTATYVSASDARSQHHADIQFNFLLSIRPISASRIHVACRWITSVPYRCELITHPI